MHSPRQWSRADAAIIAALIALTALPFAQTATFDFVSLDDAAYITQSELVQRGLDPIAMVDALGFHQDNWHPVVWWSLMLDVELFGLNPGPFHVENVFWHVLNVVLLYAAMNELTCDRWRSAFIAAVFGIHPLHVESVAWVTERKDVLSGFWWMAALWSYAVWAKTGRPRYWRFVTAALVLGLMTKQIMVTLPCVFLLLDAWPLNRWRDPSAGRWTARRLKSSVIEKLPWIGCVAVASWLAMQAQQTAAASASDWPLSLRLSNATMSLVRYLHKTIWPVGLSVQYPLTPPDSLLPVFAAGGLLLAMTVLALIVARRSPAVLVGWLWYLGVLVPVIGLVQVGSQAMADRYMYLPQIGLTMAVAWLVPDARSRPMRIGYAALAATVLIALTIRTAQQTGVWRNSDTLYAHALQVDPTNHFVRQRLGRVALAAGRVDEAIEHLRVGLEYDRKRWTARRLFAGNQDAAELDHLNRLWADLYCTLGQLEMSQRQFELAAVDLREALTLDPDFDEARLALGQSLLQVGKIDAARREFERLLERRPDNALAAAALQQLGNRSD